MSITYGITRYRQLQLGRETDAGTAVTTTVLWAGPGQMVEDDSPRVAAEQHVGTLAPTHRSYRPALRSVYNMPACEATFEQLPHIFEAGIDAESPTKDGAGTGYIRAYDLFAANTIKSYTLLGGNNVDRRRMAYSYVEQFTLSGQSDQAVMLSSAVWRGRQPVASIAFASLAVPTVETILFNNGVLSINDTGGAFGGTAVPGIWLGFNLSVTTGWIAVPSADGQLYFYGVKQIGGDAQLQLTLEHTATAATEKTNMQTGAVRLVRMLFEGNAVATPGTTYSKRRLLIDAEGTWEQDSFKTLQDQNGDDIMVGTLRIAQGTDAKGLEFLTVNETATL